MVLTKQAQRLTEKRTLNAKQMQMAVATEIENKQTKIGSLLSNKIRKKGKVNKGKRECVTETYKNKRETGKDFRERESERERGKSSETKTKMGESRKKAILTLPFPVCSTKFRQIFPIRPTHYKRTHQTNGRTERRRGGMGKILFHCTIVLRV